jgi:predicted DNA binding protein
VDRRACINCLPTLQENGISVKVLRCAPVGPYVGHSLLRVEGDPEVLDRLLSGPIQSVDDNLDIEIARSGNGVYSALVVNRQCKLSHIIHQSRCFLELAIRSDDNDLIFHIIGSDAEAIKDLMSSVKSLGYEICVISVYEKQAWGGLTYRQDLNLRKAFEAGYYDIPSKVTLDDLATEIGVSKSTLNIMLRRAERKLISDYLKNSEL